MLGKENFLSAVHIAGKYNIQADFLSRNFSDSTEWMLKKEIFQRLCAQTFLPDIDLFASRLNCQLKKFVSWFPEPGGFKTDAFSFSWQDLVPYIFPPFNLIGKILNKIIADNVSKALLIVPHWTSQSWFPLLLSCLISLPIRLPRHKNILTLPHSGRTHPLGKTLSLVAVTVSGDCSKSKDFQQQLWTSLSIHGDQEHLNNTIWHGKNGIFGVKSGKLIHFVSLR